MTDWSFLDLRQHIDVETWFADMARHLLNGCRLVVGGEPHRFTEIEFYFHAPDHPDPFPHSDPIQYDKGLWYFHKSRGAFRSGSFKGVDLTFGHDRATGGILIRGIETPQGMLIDGPSLTVDYLLTKTSSENVAALDAAIAPRKAWQAGNPLELMRLPMLDDVPIYRSARVGLSLKRTWLTEAARFVMKPYRFLTEPKRIHKGKLLLILELHVQGWTNEEIRALTGSPMRTIEGAIRESELARQAPSFEEFVGLDMRPRSLARLHGAWQRIYGKNSAVG